MKVWLLRTEHGLSIDDEDSKKRLAKIPIGTSIECDVVTRKPHSLKWRRRYWAMMRLIADNVETINIANTELDPWPIKIRDEEDVHHAMKLLTGYYDRQVFKVAGKTYITLLVKSISYENMEPEDWPAYWKKCSDAVHEHILPDVPPGVIQDEIARIAT